MGTNYEYFTFILLCKLAHLLHICIGSPVIRQVILLYIRRIDHGFPRQKIIRRNPGRLVLVIRLKSDRRISLFQPFLQSVQKLQLLCQRLIVSGSSYHLGNPPLQDLDIRKDQLQIDRLDVPQGIDASVYVNHIGVLKASDYMDDGVHFPYICQELVSKALTL